MSSINKESILLSIIIPTKDRYDTLLKVLDSLMLINSNEFEVVIQDNSFEVSTIERYLKSKNDSRIKYFHNKEKLSQTENSDLAVKNSKGEYVCFIGDDDGVMPYIVHVVKWMKEMNIRVLKGYKPDYYWPLLNSTSTSSDTSGILKSKNFTYKVERYETKSALKWVMEKGGTSMGNIPCLYHGIVHRLVLNKIFFITSSYFPGPSPDMANGVALCVLESNFYYADFPIIISGKSINSIGGQGVLHKHVSKIEDVAHLDKNTSLNWSKQIPKYWTGPTIWAESLLKSLERCGFQEKIKEINWPCLYAALIVFHSKNKREIFKGFNKQIYSLKFFRAWVSLFLNRGKYFLRNRIKWFGIMSSSGVITIEDAIQLLLVKINFQKLPFSYKPIDSSKF
jgi:glycosyltransferase involved in cell wall biosynthesis